MKILISNGNPDPANRQFDEYLEQLDTLLAGQGHKVTRLNLRNMDLRGCNGCFGCWVKQPGECLLPDDGPILRHAIITADFHLIAAPLKMGFPSALLKTALDKSIPLIHPYFTVVHGEAHHRKRYSSYPRIGMLIQREDCTDERDMHIIVDTFARAALNMKSKLEFVSELGRPVEGLAAAITGKLPRTSVTFEDRLGALAGVQITPPVHLTIFNGSPRGDRSNTKLLLDPFIAGFQSREGNTVEVHNLNRIHDGESFKAAFRQAECVLVAFPLYVDSMPGQVKAFFESLEEYVGREGNPPVGFVVQSGFPEALHSRHVERYLAKLAERLGSPYLGTLVRGGIEGIQIQPEKMTAPLFAQAQALGRSLAQTGGFDPQLVKNFAGLERFPFYLDPVFRLLSITPLLSFYWDQQLKENGVFEQRFAKPYESR